MPNPHEDERAVQLREEYLDGLSARLSSNLSPFELQDTMEELRSHLTAATDAYIEMGLSPDEGVRAAISKFGSASQIGSNLDREVRQRDRRLQDLLLAGATGGIVGAILVPTVELAYQSIYFPPDSHPKALGFAVLGVLYGAFVGVGVRRLPSPLVAVALGGLLTVVGNLILDSDGGLTARALSVPMLVGVGTALGTAMLLPHIARWAGPTRRGRSDVEQA